MIQQGIVVADFDHQRLFSTEAVVGMVAHVVQVEHSCAPQSHRRGGQQNHWIKLSGGHQESSCHTQQTKEKENKQVAKAEIAIWSLANGVGNSSNNS